MMAKTRKQCDIINSIFPFTNMKKIKLGKRWDKVEESK
jgi:hypothetical protein